MAEVKAIRERYAGQTGTVNLAVKVNQVVTGVPFGEGTVETHIDTSSGDVVMEFGKLDDADVTVTTDYDTARILYVDQDPAAGMQAFMTGKVTVQGDMMKLMALQTAMPQDEVSRQIGDEVKAITEPPPPPAEPPADATPSASEALPTSDAPPASDAPPTPDAPPAPDAPSASG